MNSAYVSPDMSKNHPGVVVYDVRFYHFFKLSVVSLCHFTKVKQGRGVLINQVRKKLGEKKGGGGKNLT